MEGQVSPDTYAQYSGHDLIKMGKTMFCDLSPPNYACDIIWEHLMMLCQGNHSMPNINSQDSDFLELMN
jgi:hypothetical protein